MTKSNEGHPFDVPVNPHDPISRHFRLYEATRSNLAVRLSIDNQPNPTQLQNIRWTATNLMDPCREEFGPIAPSSWLRVPELNDRIPGSSKTSAHQYGFAVDWRPKVATSLAAVMLWLRSSDIEYDQAILEYNSWIHLAGRDGLARRMTMMKFKGTTYLPFDVNDPRIKS